MNEQSDTQPIIDAVQRLSAHHTIDGIENVVVLPKTGGREVFDLQPLLDARLDRPKRAKGTSKHTTLDSIIAHAKRQKLDRSVIFANDDPGVPSLTVVFNYDDAPGTTGEQPDHRDHRAHYAFPLSEEWAAWAKVSGEQCWLEQSAFAELLEGRLLDVLDPSSVPQASKDIAEKLGLSLATPAALLTCAKGIAINATQTVTQAQNLSTGETEMTFAEKHAGKGGASVVVPSAFALKLPVFRGGAPYVVLARLRYRLREGVITWAVRLHRADVCFRDAFTQACDRAAKETGLPLFYGSPE